MTNPRYQTGCVDGSQERREASNSDYAWNVNLNNGNVNYNNRNNNGLVLACRRVPPSECQGVTLRALYEAFKQARKHKVASHNQVKFEVEWLTGLLKLQDQINAGTWSPRPTTCFIATKPKAREIHAPDFADRVVHHWLVPQLEKLWEPRFIFDSFSNRAGKGTHAAVDRLRGFVREIHSGQGGGYFLQLDVHNFFNSIHRPTLYRILKVGMGRYGLPEITRRVVHALLRRSPLQQGVIYRASAAERAAVPAHKRLENASPGRGIPIGNLSSQFFANVYLNELDQFAKHSLKAERYVRYVDDFVLVHRNREQLVAWKSEIERFLREHLSLELKEEQKLAPLSQGIDFLGYVIRPTHTTVRRRVISHAREKLSLWERQHINEHGACATPEGFRQLDSIWSSYCGHFSHARSAGLLRDFERRYPWLSPLVSIRRRFDRRLEGEQVFIPLRSS